MNLLRNRSVALLLLTGFTLMSWPGFAHAFPRLRRVCHAQPFTVVVPSAENAAPILKAVEAKAPGRMGWNNTRIAFEMAGKDWPSIFQWLADKSGLPFSSPYRVPGTFTFTPPHGTKYTLIEIYDIINEVLQTQHKYALVRGEASLTLVSITVEPIPRDLIPRVNLSDLKDRGRTEIVEIVIKLQAGRSSDELSVSGGKFWPAPPDHLIPLNNGRFLVRANVATLRDLLSKNIIDPDDGMSLATASPAWPPLPPTACCGSAPRCRAILRVRLPRR